MAVKKADEYQHNNPNRAFTDADFTRGGRRVVADRETLYGLVVKADQLKEQVTTVRILADAENGGVTTEVLLIDDANIGNAAGWELYNTGAGTPGNGSGGSLARYADFTFPVQSNGAQSFTLPDGTQGIDGPLQVQQVENGAVRTIGSWSLSGTTLTVDAQADLLAGDLVLGRRYYGGSPGSGGGTGGKVQASDIEGVLTEDQVPPLPTAVTDAVASAQEAMMLLFGLNTPLIDSATGLVNEDLLAQTVLVGFDKILVNGVTTNAPVFASAPVENGEAFVSSGLLFSVVGTLAQRIATLEQKVNQVPPAPAISSLDVAHAAPGYLLSITGTNLLNTSAINFGSMQVSASPSDDTNTLVTILVPNWPAGSYPVSVVAPGGTSNVLDFTIDAKQATPFALGPGIPNTIINEGYYGYSYTDASYADFTSSDFRDVTNVNVLTSSIPPNRGGWYRDNLNNNDSYIAPWNGSNGVKPAGAVFIRLCYRNAEYTSTTLSYT